MNVLLITTDQHKATTLGAYGDPLDATPALDRLAAAGTTYTRCRTQNPFCQPSRATILTGRHPSTHGVVRNGIDLPDEAVEESVASHFARAGHTTALIGKGHFASYFPDYPTGRIESVAGSALVPPDWHGPYLGFGYAEMVADVHNIRARSDSGRWGWGYGPPPFGLHYARHLFRDGRERGAERLRLMQPEAAGKQWDYTQTWKNQIDEEDHPTTWIADRAIEWLRHVDKPFFAWVSFADPHHPFDAPRPWCDRYDPADMRPVVPDAHPEEFAGKPPMHEAWTRGFRGSEYEWANPGWTQFSEQEQLTILAGYYGMIAQVDDNIGRILEALELVDLADDTIVAFTADHGDYMGDHQMMLKGPIHYEALVRVPFVVRGPGFDAGAVVDDPVGTIDLAPTFLEAAGAAVPDELEGRSLLDGTREHVLTEDDTMPGAIQLRTLTTGRWRITRDLNNEDGGELYDLDDDPGELVNRWGDPGYQAERSDLLATLDDVMRHDLGRELPQVGVAG
ncbi:MAG TPA: sulfatase-like hydrolase/transferase [Acidimicrobiia bacterium]|nr:sulfatase-like hydrolase/transferase [Acidimicrobiia bacterium]